MDGLELGRRLEERRSIRRYRKEIHDEKNYWHQVEGSINERTGREFSHSGCPNCYQRVVIPESQFFTGEINRE